jgi:hypothetical protein
MGDVTSVPLLYAGRPSNVLPRDRSETPPKPSGKPVPQRSRGRPATFESFDPLSLPAQRAPSAGMFFENPEVRAVIQNWMLDQVYDRIRVSQPKP